MSESHDMKKVLFVSQQPETVDFSDPAFPPRHGGSNLNEACAGTQR
jgi:hypothetical protein